MIMIISLNNEVYDSDNENNGGDEDVFVWFL